jgi:hypothetical protein
MGKKLLLVVFLLALISTSASSPPGRLVQLTVVNKSGLKIEISLTGQCEETFYYLRVPKGDRASPMEKTFTLVPDTYSTSLYYIELWDPVYGYSCSSKSQTLDLTRNVRMVVLPCDRTPPNSGEIPATVKYGATGGRRRR